MDSPSRTLRCAASVSSSSEDFPAFNYVSSRSLVNPWNAIHTDHAFNSLIPSASSSFHSNSPGESTLLPGYSYGDESKLIPPLNGLQICTNQYAYPSVNHPFGNSDVIHGHINPGVSTLSSSDEVPYGHSISSIGGSTMLVNPSGNPSYSLNGIQPDFMAESDGTSCLTSDPGSTLNFTSPVISESIGLIQELLDSKTTISRDLMSYYNYELSTSDYWPDQSYNIVPPIYNRPYSHGSTAEDEMHYEPASNVHNTPCRRHLNFEMSGDGRKGLYFSGSEQIGSSGRQLSFPSIIDQSHIATSSHEPLVSSPSEPLHSGIKIEENPKRKRLRWGRSRGKKTCQRCKCDKSKCLKLYCACFAAGLYCVEPCSCQGCFNKLEFQDKVRRIRAFIKSRNPFAFSPKVISSSDHMAEFWDVQRNSPASSRHRRGCNCKKSSCSKNYCECFQGRVGCSSSCRCEGCKNKFGIKEGESFECTEIHNHGEQDLGSALQITTPLLPSRPLTVQDQPSCSSFVNKGTPPSASCAEQILENLSIIKSLPDFEDGKLVLESVVSDFEHCSLRDNFRTTSNGKRVSPINCDSATQVLGSIPSLRSPQ